VASGHPCGPSEQLIRTQIRPALTSFAGECCGMPARLIAYVGALALVAIVGVDLLGSMATRQQDERSNQAGAFKAGTLRHHRFA
jgi:hypothetical protein